MGGGKGGEGLDNEEATIVEAAEPNEAINEDNPEDNVAGVEFGADQANGEAEESTEGAEESTGEAESTEGAESTGEAESTEGAESTAATRNWHVMR